ncbi:hypothetical protein NMG60_11026043 [Bertholletia excelsa]
MWKKKSIEKTIVSGDKLIPSQKGNETETDKAELERNLTILNDKLSFALSECNAKDTLVEKHAKMEQEAHAGWMKAGVEVMSLRQELDEVIRQRVAGEERSTHLDMALKECMQQLRFVRQEQEQRIRDAVMKSTQEFEKIRTILEEELTDTNKKLAKLGAENSQLNKALLAKEKYIEDLNQQRKCVEADFNALVTRLESTEKENASLKYEIRVLERELEIRNEEREFNRRTADAAQKQHEESAKKIAKLESECQRLRVLVRKRLPGPAAVAKMKNEVQVLGKDRTETWRRKSNPSLTSSVDFALEDTLDTSSKRINYMAEQLYAMEEENRSLKETLNKKNNELQLSRSMYSHAASKLSQAEAQLEESSIAQVEPARNVPIPRELSLASMSDMGSDKVSTAESWASALISELEHFKNGKKKLMKTTSRNTVGTSEIDLMDDFVEMEKLAIVSLDKQSGSSHLDSAEGSEIVGPLETPLHGNSLAAGSRRISSVNGENQDVQSRDILFGKFPSWLQDIVKAVFEQSQISQKKPDDILKDVKVALQCVSQSKSCEFIDVSDSPNLFNVSNHSDVICQLSGKPSDEAPLKGTSKRMIGDTISSGKKSNNQVKSSLSKSIGKTIELIEGIGIPSMDYGATETFSAKDSGYFPYKNSVTPSGYMVRVFQWKISELTAVIQQFIGTCNDLLIGKADLEIFAEELASALDWVINHCFSLQDVSSIWEDSRSESEMEGGTNIQFSEADKLRTPKQLSYLCVFSPWNDLHMGETMSNTREESKNPKDELANKEPANKDLKGELQSETDKSEYLMFQLQESEKMIKNLQSELGTLEELKTVIENHKLVNDNLDTQLTVARAELNEFRNRFSYLETELENKSACCEELKVACLDLQLKLESGAKKEIPNYSVNQEEKQLQADWEITAASEKLAECQETILNLGKQLKALASPRDTALFNKVVSNPLDDSMTANTTSTPNKGINQRTSLLDKMLAEDKAKATDLKFPKTKEVTCIPDPQKLPDGTMDPPENEGRRNGDDAVGGGSLAIVPSKKKVGLLKKLLCSRQKGYSKGTTTTVKSL